MSHLITDRRLCVTADRTTIVEEGNPAASWLLYPAGRKVGEGDIKRYGLKADEFGRVTYDGCPALPALEAESEHEPKAKSKPKKKAEAETETDDSDRNDEPVPDWTARTSPEKYLELYPTGPKAELAARVIAANAGADGAS